MYIGRNIQEENGRFYLTINWDRDLTSSHDKSYIRFWFDSHRSARLKMTKFINSGAYWFDAHYDPSI